MLSYISSTTHVLMSSIGRNAETNLSLLQSKIRELKPVHRNILGALLRHLLHVASHSDKADIKRLADAFRHVVFRIISAFDDHGTALKARCINLL